MGPMIADKKFPVALFALAAALAWTACSNGPKPMPAETKSAAEAGKEAPKPPEPVTAKTAFYEMYKPARAWAADLLPLSLASGEIPSMKNEGGKAALWTAVFVSPSLREARTFFYAVADQGDSIRRGVSAGGSQTWSGSTPQSRPFQTTGFVVNSDAAYQAALAKAGPWVKSHPDKKVTFFLFSSAKFPQPVWLVLWGTNKAGFVVYVDATTGLASLK
jgi:hypothetical protein